MTKASMKTQWLLLLVCLLTSVLGEVRDEEHLKLQDLLINVQSTLKAFKQDLDEIRKSVDDRLDKFEKSVQAFKEEVSGRLDKCELQVSKLVVPHDCADVYDQQSQLSGVYTIQPLGSRPFQVYCDMTTDGGGWTVFQRRGNFSGVKKYDFYKNWQEYQDGFGDIKGEFWTGLSKISLMSNPVNGDQVLRIDLTDLDGERRFAEYRNFIVRDEKQLFRLSIGNYSGDAGDSLSYHNLQMFTTQDSDNDGHAKNCAVTHKGGWWYHSCAASSLNGLNLRVAKDKSQEGIWWGSWRGRSYSLAQTEMKFRPMAWSQKK